MKIFTFHPQFSYSIYLIQELQLGLLRNSIKSHKKANCVIFDDNDFPKIIRLLSSIGNISIMTLLEHSHRAFIAFISIRNYLYRLYLVGKSNWEPKSI